MVWVQSRTSSGVPSEMCPSETLEGDVLGVVIFGFVGWEAKIHGGKMGEFSNYGENGGNGICCCSDKGSKTKGVYVIGLIVID